MTEKNPPSRPLGYARVSTYGQTLDAQLEQLRAAGCAKIYREKATGARPDRRELLKLLKALAPGDVVVLPGDTPLVRPATLAALVRRHRATDAAATLLTAVLDDPGGYDRVVRGKDGGVERVVYDTEVDGEERAIDEVATTIHCFHHGVLAPALRRLQPVGPRLEHSLTGIYAVLHDAGYRVESLQVSDPMEAAGVNDRAQLSVAEAELRARINERWMRRGVTMWDPEQTYVDASVRLAEDVVLGPGVVLQGDCVVGAGAEIGPGVVLQGDCVVGAGAEVGPGCHLVDTEVGDAAVVMQTMASGARIGPRSTVGPFVALGSGAEVAPGAVVPAFSQLPAGGATPGPPGG